MEYNAEAWETLPRNPGDIDTWYHLSWIGGKAGQVYKIFIDLFIYFILQVLVVPNTEEQNRES